MKNVNTSKKLKFTLSLLSILIILAVCLNLFKEDNEGSNERAIGIVEKEEMTDSVDSYKGKGLNEIFLEVNLDDAVEFFYESFDKERINISFIQLERKDNHYFYKIKGWDQKYHYNLAINAETSEIMEEEKEESKVKNDILDLSSTINPKQAMELVIEADESVFIHGWELEVEEQEMIYNIVFKDSTRQKVDALTGELLY